MVGSYFSNDTIVAIATSMGGDAGVGIIRLSGPHSHAVSKLVCPGFREDQPRYLQRVELLDFNGEVLDDGLAAFFPEGASFTGEQVVELQLHGGRFLLQKILRLLLKVGSSYGLRIALPGEFSFRAVRNGRMSLSGAQALGQLITAKSNFEVSSARRTLGKSRTEQFDQLASSIRNLLAQSELSIDFIDQDVEVISQAQLEQELERLILSTTRTLSEMAAAQRIAKGLVVALVGIPNAGKSTLFNSLLTEDRAIVSAEAGTTRDVITEDIALGPYLVRLADTAGLRIAAGLIEKEGIERAKALAVEADAVVLLVDSTLTTEEVIAQVRAGLQIRHDVIIALNKWDAISANQRAILNKSLSEFEYLVLSAQKNEGVLEVLSAIQGRLDTTVGIGIESFLPTEFQLQMLEACRQALIEAKSVVLGTGLGSPELVSISLSTAAKALSDLVGETTPDTVLTQIFSEFCIGK